MINTNNLKLFASGIIFLSLLLYLSGCEETGEEVIDEVNQQTALATIQKEWIRIASNNPSVDGMTVEIEETTGTVTYSPTISISAGDVKWLDITATGENTFTHQELGSDGNYYSAGMTLENDTLYISIDAAGAGNQQKWVENTGNYVQTRVLTQPDFEQDIILKNMPASVDYRIETVIDIDNPTVTIAKNQRTLFTGKR